MYLKDERIIIELDGVRMTSHMDTGLASQFNLDPTAFSGWLDGVSARRNSTTRLSAHGDFKENAVLASRLISLQGIAFADSPYNLKVMRDRLVGILSDGKYDVVSIQMGDTRYATVGLEGKTSWVPTTDRSANWKIELYAPDPYIYGEQRIVQTGANVSKGGLAFTLAYPLDYNIVGDDTAKTIWNNGNAESWPTFKVVGDYYSGFTIGNNLGKKVTYNGQVTMQAPVSIDMAAGTAIQGGVDKTYLISERGWFSIPPNSAIQPDFTPIQNGSGWCDVIFRDTWI